MLIYLIIFKKDERQLEVMHHGSFEIPASHLSLDLLSENHHFLNQIFRSLDPALAIFLYPKLFLNYIIVILLLFLSVVFTTGILMSATHQNVLACRTQRIFTKYGN